MPRGVYERTAEARKKQSEAQKKVQGTPEARKKNSEAHKKYFEDPEARKSLSEVHKKRWEDKYWYGSVTYNTKPQYCVKFKIVKPKVRAFFNHTCCVCGKVENGKAHHVHHVFYDKKSCCLEDVDGLYYSNLHTRGHREKDYCIGENPNYFVLLCGSCHAKTSRMDFELRSCCADWFKDLIDTKYGGICWKEPELETFKSHNNQ